MKPTLLIIGAGDVARRALPWLTQRFRVVALTRKPEDRATLRALGVLPILGDLDTPSTLKRLAGIGHRVLYLAPPPGEGTDDPRCRHLLAQITAPRSAGKHQAVSLPRALVYVSTTGVYGDCKGNWITESRPLAPQTPRAQRRVAAERAFRRWGRRTGSVVSILRAPGIYAETRLPTERIRQGTPVLLPEEDSYTNHIHADDLARIAGLALFRGRPMRTYNAVDHSEMKMGDYFQAVADTFQLSRPPRQPLSVLLQTLSAQSLSFLQESRRIRNRRLTQEMRIRLRHPTVDAFLQKMVRHAEK